MAAADAVAAEKPLFYSGNGTLYVVANWILKGEDRVWAGSREALKRGFAELYPTYPVTYQSSLL